MVWHGKSIGESEMEGGREREREREIERGRERERERERERVWCVRARVLPTVNRNISYIH